VTAECCDTETSRLATELADAHQEVYACVGWHPTYTAKYAAAELKFIEELAAHPKTVAIGEIGLDYHWDYSTPEQQRSSLEDHWALAQSLSLPVVFHCREAYHDLLEWLGAKQPNSACILHCFSGNPEDAQRAISMGAYFGVDGPITYKNADALREIVRLLPRERILAETDSPYLTPHPHRGKPNEPRFVELVIAEIAATLTMDISSAIEITTANALGAMPRLGRG
jgi:TatD DNase family protein